jgi:anthranilate synthase component 2
VFAGLKNPFTATRYHSLTIEKATAPEVLEITAWTDDGEIMGVQHKTRPIHGVQFHPESIATECGHELLANFLDIAGVRRLAQV